MTTIVDKLGRIVSKVSGDAESIRLNTPEGCLAVADPPRQDMQYVDGEWLDLPSRPSLYHYFDYSTKQWLDPRSLDEIKVQKWAEIKSQRDQLEFGGFEYAGNIYDSDQVSQSRIMGAAMAGVDQTWTLVNNSTVNLTASQLQQLYAALQAHIASVHERGRIARLLIYEATTSDEVEAVIF